MLGWMQAGGLLLPQGSRPCLAHVRPAAAAMLTAMCQVLRAVCWCLSGEPGTVSFTAQSHLKALLEAFIPGHTCACMDEDHGGKMCRMVLSFGWFFYVFA